MNMNQEGEPRRGTLRHSTLPGLGFVGRQGSRRVDCGRAAGRALHPARLVEGLAAADAQMQPVDLGGDRGIDHPGPIGRPHRNPVGPDARAEARPRPGLRPPDDYLLQDSSHNESLIIHRGMTILMGPDSVAEVTDQLARTRFAVSELPHEPLRAELIVVQASRLSDSIRVKQHCVVPFESHVAFLEGFGVIHPQGKTPDVVQGVNRSIGTTFHKRRRVAGVGVGKPPSRRLVNAEERGDENAKWLVAQLPIDMPQQRRRPPDPCGMRVKHGLNDPHDDCGGQPMPGGIADEDAPPGGDIELAIVERETVVKVSPGARQGFVTGRDLQAGTRRHGHREHRALQFTDLSRFLIEQSMGAAEIAVGVQPPEARDRRRFENVVQRLRGNRSRVDVVDDCRKS